MGERGGRHIYFTRVPGGLVLTVFVGAGSPAALFLPLTCRLYRRYGSLNLDVILMRARRERPAED